MASSENQPDRLALARELRERGESERRRDGAMARLCYEEAVVLLREFDEPLVLAHTIRHLGDVYLEQGRPDLAEPCYLEALACIGITPKIRRWTWRTRFEVSRCCDGSRPEHCGKRRASFIQI